MDKKQQAVLKIVGGTETYMSLELEAAWSTTGLQGRSQTNAMSANMTGGPLKQSGGGWRRHLPASGQSRPVDQEYMKPADLKSKLVGRYHQCISY